MKNNQRTLSLKTVALALAFSGGAALIYEIAATEALFYYFNNNVYSVATVLSTFLLGLALGSLFISKRLKRIKSKPLLFVILQFIIGFYALFVFTNFNLIPQYLSFITKVIPQDSFFLVILSKFIVGSLYLILPTFLFGTSLPLAASIVIKKVKEAGANVGTLYSWDLFGSIAGVLLAGFLIMPLAGLKAACFFGGGLNFLSGFLIFKKEKRVKFILGVLILTIFILSYFLIDPLNEKRIVVIEGINDPLKIAEGKINGLSQEEIDLKKLFKKNYPSFEKEQILYQAFTPYGALHVIGEGEEIKLFINRRSQCAKSIETEKLFADLALDNIEGKNLKVLVVGLGCGYTLDSFLKYERVGEIDVVEINSRMPEVVPYFFNGKNPLDDERVNLIIDDGFQYFQKTDKKYDIVSIDIEEPLIAHSSPLYTVESFKLASQVLKEDGLFEIYGFAGSYEYLKVFYNSLNQAFPHVYFSRIKEILIFFASKTPLEEVDLTVDEKEILEKLKKDEDYILNTMNYPILKYKFGYF